MYKRLFALMLSMFFVADCFAGSFKDVTTCETDQFAESFKGTSTCETRQFAGSFKDISTCETERLVVDVTKEDDLDTLSEYLLDKDVTKYLDFSIMDGFSNKEDARAYLKQQGGEWDYGVDYTIKLKDEKKTPIGMISVMYYNNFNIAAIGYWLGKDFQKKGYAREACCKLCNQIMNSSDVRSLYICCISDNTASYKLASCIFDYIKTTNEDMELWDTRYESVYKLDDNQENGDQESDGQEVKVCEFWLTKKKFGESDDAVKNEVSDDKDDEQVA